MTIMLELDKTFEEVEAENEFLVKYFKENSPASGPEARWASIATTRLLIWAYFGEDIPSHNMPWTPYEMDIVNRFLERVPPHLSEIIQPKIEEFKEMVAVRQEKEARDSYLRTKR